MNAIQIGVVAILFAAMVVSSEAQTKQLFTQPFYQKIGSNLYLFAVDPMMNWFEALQYCRSNYGNLALIESAKELEAISDYLIKHGRKNQAFWIDGNDISTIGSFQSFTTGKNLPYTEWARSQGQKTDNNCLYLWWVYDKLRINDCICNGKAYAMCKIIDGIIE